MSNTSIRFRQINMQHAQLATDHLVTELKDMIDPFITLIQEPWINGNKIMGLNGAGTLYYNRSGRRPRSAILTSKDIAFCPCPQFTGDDITAGIWYTGAARGFPTEVYIASVYSEFHDVLISEKLGNLVQF